MKSSTYRKNVGGNAPSPHALADDTLGTLAYVRLSSTTDVLPSTLRTYCQNRDVHTCKYDLRLNSTFAFSPFQVPFGGKVCNYIQPFYVSFYMGKKRRWSYTRSQGKREDRGRTGFFPLRMP